MSASTVRRTALAAILIAAPAACAGPHLSSDRDEAIPVPRGATWAWSAPDTLGDWERDPALAGEITEQRFRRALDTAMEARGFRRVDDPGAADFLLTYHIGVRRAPHGAAMHGGAGGNVSVGLVLGVGPGVGWGPGWGPPGYGYGRGYGSGYGYGYGPGFGFGPSWGWGAGMYAYPGWGWGLYGPPIYGGVSVATYAAQYGMGALVVLLRQRSSGEVAWQGLYALDPYEMQSVTQRHVQAVVDRLMEKLQ